MAYLTQTSSLHELLDEFPFLVEFLAEFNPHYAMLRNPEMRATAARFATLEMVAGMGGVALEDLIRAMEGEVKRQKGARVGDVADPPPAQGGPEGPGSGPGSGDSEDRAVDRIPPASGGRAEKAAALKSIIEDLHGGLSADVARARFDAVVRDVSPQEIGAMEEQLILEGTPVEEIQRLCDLHVAVVRGGLEKRGPAEAPPGHPAHTYFAANEIITGLANRLGELCAELGGGAPAEASWRAGFLAVLEEIGGIHNHYLRKEHELFPVLERHGITGPSKVMWGVHDEIRAQLKEARGMAENLGPEAAETGARLARAVVEMVYKENRILLPLALETLTHEEWGEVRRGEDELGYAFVAPAGPFRAEPLAGPAWAMPGNPPARTGEDASRGPASLSGAPSPLPRAGLGPGLSLPIVSGAPTAPLPQRPEGYLDLGTGRLSLEQVDMLLRHLPVDLSFVDADGYVRYYSETEERLFPRTPGAIGRHVTNCHPPKSVHMVEEILRAFAGGERDVAEFWIEMQGKFIHIRYFAVRNPAKEYLGCLEVTQDVTGIRALEGQRRLLEWS